MPASIPGSWNRSCGIACRPSCAKQSLFGLQGAAVLTKDNTLRNRAIRDWCGPPQLPSNGDHQRMSVSVVVCPRFETTSAAAPPDAENKMVRTAGLEPAFPFEKQIFVPPRLSPPPHWRSWSGLSLRHSLPTVGAARLVSTPSPRGAWLGIGLVKTLSFPRL